MLDPLLKFLPAVAHAVGVLAAIHVLLTARTPQAAIAWSLSMLTLPYVAVPAYFLFGQNRFHGYVQALRAGSLKRNAEEAEALLKALEEHRYNPEPRQENHVRVLEKLARLPFTEACSVELLIDGEAKFARLHAELEKAREYIQILYFIVNDDATGRRLLETLCRKAREGVRVYFVYDEMGSQKMTKEYLDDLRAAGVEAHPFNTTQGWRNRFQVNFRNHRKIVVVDGKVALVGGLNVGDEELGLSRHYGIWRDTHVVVEGPAVLSIQMVFAEDYYWATGGADLPQFSWTPHCAAEGRLAATYLASGPADSLDVGVMFFLECIHAARERLWLASPYFVPDPSILDALKMADLRGVEVRIILPPGRYEPHMHLAALSYLPELEGTGIRLYRFPTYNHSKVMLVDDWLSWVGSANLDNRSLRLNFEGNLVVVGQPFAKEVEKMLRRDLDRSRPLGLSELRRLGILTLLGSKIARLFAPVL